MYKQIIIVRKDLHLTSGKMAAQVSHASIAFLTTMIRSNSRKVINENIGYAYDMTGKPQYYRHPDLNEFAKKARDTGVYRFYYKPKDPLDEYGAQIMCNEPTIKEYKANISLNKELYEEWISGEFTKVILQAKNRNQLYKAKEKAEKIGMKEGVDFFMIRDNCHTELTPEEYDEHGVGRTLTCIGFTPMDCNVIDEIGRSYQLYTE